MFFRSRPSSFLFPSTFQKLVLAQDIVDTLLIIAGAQHELGTQKIWLLLSDIIIKFSNIFLTNIFSRKLTLLLNKICKITNV